MTREEAIKFGNTWLETFGDAKDSNTYNFFKISIKALEKEQKMKLKLNLIYGKRRAMIFLKGDKVLLDPVKEVNLIRNFRKDKNYQYDGEKTYIQFSLKEDKGETT